MGKFSAVVASLTQAPDVSFDCSVIPYAPARRAQAVQIAHSRSTTRR
jgi:hypothetical protein